MAIGVLLMYTIGSWLPWHADAACCTPVPCLLAICLSFFYDSPYWYFHIGKEKSAHSAIEQFRGSDSNVVSEVFQIQEHVRGETEEITFIEGVTKGLYREEIFQAFLNSQLLVQFKRVYCQAQPKPQFNLTGLS